MKKNHGFGYKYPSVTTILACHRKIGLEIWFLNNTPQFCREESKKGKETGKDIHTVIQQCIEGERMTIKTDYPDEVNFAVNSFLKFKKEHPEYILKQAEIQLDCDKYGYSGQLDCHATEKTDNIIVDWKSGKPNSKGKLVIYDEMVYQVAMYSVGYELQFNKKIKRAVVALFDKTSVNYITRIVEKDEIEAVFKNVCLSFIKIYNYERRKK